MPRPVGLQNDPDQHPVAADAAAAVIEPQLQLQLQLQFQLQFEPQLQPQLTAEQQPRELWRAKPERRHALGLDIRHARITGHIFACQPVGR